MDNSKKNINSELVKKYKVDNTILESYFKNSKNQDVKGMTFPLRIDNRQYCSPTDYQGDMPTCCGYTAAQIMESINWMNTGKILQMDANQIYAKSKQTEGNLSRQGTYPDLALKTALNLVPNAETRYDVVSSTENSIDELKRAVHGSMFVSVNMTVTKDLYNLNQDNFVYQGEGSIAGGHSLVCCGYDEESKMLILQNHWGVNWGLKGFFLCPYDVWKRQNNIICWYELKVNDGKKKKCVVDKTIDTPLVHDTKTFVDDNQPKVDEDVKLGTLTDSAIKIFVTSNNIDQDKS